MLKNKRHWNSFTTLFFIPLHSVIESLERRLALLLSNDSVDSTPVAFSSHPITSSSISAASFSTSSTDYSPIDKLLDAKKESEIIPYYTRIHLETPFRCHICASTQFKTFKSLLEHVTSHR